MELFLCQETGKTLHQIQIALRREVYPEVFFREHFHSGWWLNPLSVAA
jgi:hypothetical protein